MMIILSSLHPAYRCVNTIQKVPCPAVYKYNGDVVITRYCIVKNDCLAFQNEYFLYFLTNM